LDIWNKILASKTLSDIVVKSYLDRLEPNEKSAPLLQKLDLFICFFHHYIYAFDEFSSRKFRHSVIRCGLICERIVKRLAVAAGHPEVLEIQKFEDKANRTNNLLQGKCSEIDHLTALLKYVYHGLWKVSRFSSFIGARFTPSMV
jgi:hypothetical protein